MVTKTFLKYGLNKKNVDVPIKYALHSKRGTTSTSLLYICYGINTK